MGLDSFLRDIENKINNVTESCNNSVNSVKEQITQKSDEYIEKNFNDIRYSSDNINKCINDGIDKLFTGNENKEKKKLLNENSNNLNDNINNEPLNKPKVNLQKK